MDAEQNQVQTGKFYTSARKIPQLIGVTPTGEKIPGGPYTVTQFALGILVLVLGFVTRPIWGSGDIFSEILILLFVTAGVIYGAGKMPRTRRSPLNLTNCAMSLFSRPATGKYRGRKLPNGYGQNKINGKKRAKTQQVTGNRKNAVASSDAGEVANSKDTTEPAQIYSGLDRLMADLTTAR